MGDDLVGVSPILEKRDMTARVFLSRGHRFLDFPTAINKQILGSVFVCNHVLNFKTCLFGKMLRLGKKRLHGGRTAVAKQR